MSSSSIKTAAYRNMRIIKDIADCMEGVRYMVTITGRTDDDRTFASMRKKLQTLDRICTSIGIDIIGIVAANQKQGYHIHAIIGDIGMEWMTDFGGGRARRRRGKPCYYLHPAILEAIDGVGYHLVQRIGDNDINHVADYIARHLPYTRKQLRDAGISYARPVRHTRGMVRSNRQRYYHHGTCIRVFDNKSKKGAAVLPADIAYVISDIIDIDRVERYRWHGRDMVRMIADYRDIILALCISGIRVMLHQKIKKWLYTTPVLAYTLPIDAICRMSGGGLYDYECGKKCYPI